jgi:hypothetical protein
MRRPMKVVRAVIDTNVILVANAAHADASPGCVIECIDRLVGIQKSGHVVLDDDFRILSEYLKKTFPSRPKKFGDVFVKWVLQNQANLERVERVRITEVDSGYFDEFPDQAVQTAMDPADRKFVAVAASHHLLPPIWQAVDCKWLDFVSALQLHGIVVDFICLDDARKFYRSKFPGKPVPEI